MPSIYPKEINTLGDHFRVHRLGLKLLQEQVAGQIGVHEMTITGCEGNATAPAILHFLGHNPLPTANSIPERLAKARRVP